MKHPPTRLKTAEEVRKNFLSRGMSVRSWAIQNGVDPITAAHVVAGRSKGNLGEAHRVAVMLGLKEGVIEDRAPRRKAA